MPTRKQRRRRAKELRHEYVWEDDEGNELEPDEVRGDGEPRSRRSSARPGREPQAPSWQRTLKRGVIFAPVMFVVVMLLSGDLTLTGQLTQTALIVAIFIPFSYLLDGLMYRSYKRRTARGKQTDNGRGS
ncbi:MAG TPA: hypothetical protein VNO56_00285 [Gaiellaceae bacterium]|nr:hypothetical protein [Gaiellaceae bacterium]